MTISKTILSALTGPSLTRQQLEETKAEVWFLGLGLWMWRWQPHLRERPVWNTKVINEIEYFEFEPEIKFKNVYAIPVWDIDMNYISYYILYTIKGNYPLGRVSHLEYLLDASKTKI